MAHSPSSAKKYASQMRHWRGGTGGRKPSPLSGARGEGLADLRG